MPNFPDPDRDGTFSYRLNNGDGKFSRGLWIPSGATPALKLQTAGFGLDIVAADGSTVILALSESGGAAPTTQVIPDKAADPSPGADKQIYYHSGEGVFKLFDGTTAEAIVTAS